MTITTARRAKGRAPLNRDRVLRAAVNLADREGIGTLSMRRLGQELGVEAMSLYNHVQNKEEVLDGMVDIIVGEIDSPAGTGDWKQLVRNRILAARRVMLRHPWASAVIVARRAPSPTVMAYMDRIGGLMLDGGLSLDLMHHGFHALGSRVLGFSQEPFDDSNELQQSPEIQALMVRQLSEAYPNLGALMEQVAHDDASVVGTGCDDQFEFEFALDLLLDGLEQLRLGQS